MNFNKGIFLNRGIEILIGIENPYFLKESKVGKPHSKKTMFSLLKGR